jgi:RNA polymerase primary sigma factor
MKKVSHKLLSGAEEKSLAQKIEKGDNRARDKMITHNLRLALSIANQYRKSGLPMEDIAQEANVGLIKAVDRFDWRKGFKFSTYAVWWIRQAIRRYISSQSTAIKFPAGSRHTIWKITTLRKEYQSEFGVFPEDSEVAALMGMTKEAVRALRVGMQWPINIDAPIKGFDGRTYAEIIPDEDSQKHEDILDREMLIGLIKTGFSSLTRQEEMVLRLRFGISEDDKDTENFPHSKTNVAVNK